MMCLSVFHIDLYGGTDVISCQWEIGLLLMHYIFKQSLFFQVGQLSFWTWICVVWNAMTNMV